jgi:hypothetical protein
MPSGLIASLPNKENESGDQASHDEHPVLTFEAKKGKMLNQELHRSAPFFRKTSVLLVQNRHFGATNILFLYERWP